MLWIRRIAFLVPLVLGFQAFGFEDPKGPSPDVPEAAQLKVYVGKFKMEVTEPIKATGEVEGKWALDGRYVQQTFTLKDDKGNLAITGTNMFTFDKKKNMYRSWRFFSNGDTADFTGIWDAEKQVMTWTEPNPDNKGTIRMVGTFDKSGTQIWVITAEDSTGKVETEIRGSHTPIK